MRDETNTKAKEAQRLKGKAHSQRQAENVVIEKDQDTVHLCYDLVVVIVRLGLLGDLLTLKDLERRTQRQKPMA